MWAAVDWAVKIDIKNIISNVDMMSTTTTTTCYPILCETAHWKYNNQVFMAQAGAGRHGGLTDTDWIYLKFSKVSLSLQTEFIISRQSELTDMKDNETKIDCTLIHGDLTLYHIGS